MATPLPVLLAQIQQLATAAASLQDLVIRNASGPAAERVIRALAKADGWLVDAAVVLQAMVDAEQAEVRA